jgi:hypothetical protein
MEEAVFLPLKKAGPDLLHSTKGHLLFPLWKRGIEGDLDFLQRDP